MSKNKLTAPLSNYDLLGEIAREMKERGNIYDLADIHKAQTLEDVFKGRGHAILFEPPKNSNDDVGHWTALLRNGNGIIYFDSYGGKMKNEGLKRLISQHHNHIQINPKQFQDYGESAVCGRYALTCIGLNKLFKNITVKDIIKFLNDKPHNKSFDEFIVSLTREL